MDPKRVGGKHCDTVVDAGVLQAEWTPLQEGFNHAAMLIRGYEPADAAKLGTKMKWHTHVYNMATKDQETVERLYNVVKRWCTTDVENNITSAARQIVATEDHTQEDLLLRFLVKSFAEFELLAKFSGICLGYIDQYTAKKSGYVHVRSLFFNSFFRGVNAVFDDALYSNAMSAAIGRLMATGSVQDRIYVASAIRMYQVGEKSDLDAGELQRNVARVDEFFAAAIPMAYTTHLIASRLTVNGDCGAFVEWAEKTLAVDTRFLSNTTLSLTICDRIVAVLDSNLLQANMQHIISHPASGVAALLQQHLSNTDDTDTDALDHLKQMHRLFRRIPNGEGDQLIIDEVKSFQQTRRAESAADGEAEAKRISDIWAVVEASPSALVAPIVSGETDDASDGTESLISECDYQSLLTNNFVEEEQA